MQRTDREEAGANPARSRHCHRSAVPDADPEARNSTRRSADQGVDTQGRFLREPCTRACRPVRTGVSTYPFSAVVGMDDLKLALLVNAVSPAVGGVLLRGEKGTAKSTVVRGLAALLPPVRVVADCRFSCPPAAPDPGCPDGPHPLDAPADT